MVTYNFWATDSVKVSSGCKKSTVTYVRSTNFVPVVFDMKWRGSDATEREGAYWSISDGLDTPAWVLYNSPRRAAPGTATIAGLQFEDVRTENALRTADITLIM